jgi:hypothetical protein
MGGLFRAHLAAPARSGSFSLQSGLMNFWRVQAFLKPQALRAIVAQNEYGLKPRAARLEFCTF